MKKDTIFLILLALIAVVVGGTLYYFVSQEEEIVPIESEVINLPKAPKVSLPKTLYNLAGIIKEIEDKIISLEVSIPFLDEYGQPFAKTEMRRVVITNSTKLSLLTFVETQPGRKTPQETSITFKNFKVGDYVDVISNRDISQAEEFEATQIRIISK